MKQNISVKYQRHELIVDRVNEEGKIYVTELAKELDITPETLRRDLSELEEEKELVRIHGGLCLFLKMTAQNWNSVRK